MTALLFVLMLAASAGGAFTPQPPVVASPSAQDDYVIGPQDVLNVTVFNEPDASRLGVAVDGDGTIDCPYIGRIKAAGLTTRGLEQDIKERLGKGFLVNPSVSVEVVKYRSRTVWVQGRVRNPGEFPLQGNASIMTALALAGSMTPDAGSYVIITHRPPGQGTGPVSPSDPGAEQVRVSRRDLESGRAQKIMLKDGDTILVPAAEKVSVYGYVRTPGDVVFEDGLTVEKAIFLAGGPTERASTKRVTIDRVVDGKIQRLKVKLEDLVQPNDVIRVPQRIL
jgi:polysaccharide biosynthesis/export protein